MIAYTPENDIFRYTIFQAHVQKLFSQPKECLHYQMDKNELDDAIKNPDRMHLVPDEPKKAQPKKRLIDILDEGEVFLICGTHSAHKTGFLLKGATECIRSYVPCWIDCGNIINLKAEYEIYESIKQMLAGNQSLNVREIIWNSPQILFFFDLSRESKNISSTSARALANFINSCQRNGDRQHKFAVAYEFPNDYIYGNLKDGIAEEKRRNYKFLRRLDFIAYHEAYLLEDAFDDYAKETELIKEFLRNFQFNKIPKDRDKLLVRRAIREKLCNHNDPEVRKLADEILRSQT